MSSWIFQPQLCVLKDVPRTLNNLSLFIQSVDASLINAGRRKEQAYISCPALKTPKDRAIMPACLSLTKSFKDVTLKQTDAYHPQFETPKNQFFQSLYDNLEERFNNIGILTAAQVLDVNMFPQDWLKLTNSSNTLT